ncbi:MAG TPA: hypothetical protein DCS66_11540 [Flavobacteriaceae bacterium]|nr:hypothetical protein [Legionellales bacterium]MAZ40476.1 hypothetical protein [Legionellales bacterium]HAT65216.1 hypothetical protein [Flavobacteriaceae bacterium]|tara:strand:+ start:1780 stop:2139 length:360 start_codon:yes stop_codon:yes gene_type:complete
MLYITPKFHEPILIKESGITIASFTLKGLSNSGIDIAIDTKLSVKVNSDFILDNQQNNNQKVIASNIGQFYTIGEDILFILEKISKYGVEVGINAPRQYQIERLQHGDKLYESKEGRYA